LGYAIVAVRVGVVGDFDPGFVSHTATNDSLVHSAARLGTEVDVVWLPTPSLTDAKAPETLAGFDGLWISAGSPYRDRNGAFAAIRFARERGRPMVAT
jgi:CTP synthase (UTP-ammonia lyase)